MPSKLQSIITLTMMLEEVAIQPLSKTSGTETLYVDFAKPFKSVQSLSLISRGDNEVTVILRLLVAQLMPLTRSKLENWQKPDRVSSMCGIVYASLCHSAYLKEKH